MKKYLIIISVIAMLLCFTTAMAAPVDTYEVETATTTLVITGKIDGYVQGNQYRVIVFAKDKVYDENAEYNDTKIAEDIIFMSQIAANEEGGYTARVGMKDKGSGFYTVRVNGKDAIKLYYATETDKKQYLRSVKITCQTGGENVVENLEKLLDLNDGDSTLVNYFMVSDKYVTSVDSGTLADILYYLVKEDPLLVSSEEKFVSAVEKAAHVAALNEDEIAISELFDELNFDEEYVKFYNDKLTDKAKVSVVTNGYKGKEYNCIEAEDAFNDAVVYAYITNLSSWADAKYFIETHGKDYNVDVSDYEDLSTSNKNKLYDYMTGSVSKSSVESFVKLVNDKIDDLKDAKESSGGGSGGGGGGFASGTTGGFETVTPDMGTDSVPDGFVDMADYAWAKESVDALASKGIVSGVGDNKFEPSRNVKREEMLAMLLRAYDVNVEGAVTDKFTDVTGANWYAPYVAAGLDKGYVNGVSETEFGAGANVSRQDVAVMAYRIAISKGKTFPANSEAFADEMQIADYAKEAVNALKAAGVINGRGDGSFAPNDTCTRAEAAKIIYTLIK